MDKQECCFCGVEVEGNKDLLFVRSGTGLYLCEVCIELCNDTLREKKAESKTLQ